MGNCEMCMILIIFIGNFINEKLEVLKILIELFGCVGLYFLIYK